MARDKKFKYFYKTFFRPGTLDIFEGFDYGLRHDGRGLGYAQVWHKGNTEISKFAVFNEYICGELGKFLRLPIPPFAMTHYDHDGGRQIMFSSLDFNFSRANLPQIIPEFCVQRMGDVCAGILVFDILIANEDRHDENLLVDDVSRPREMHVYDHDQALLGGAFETGRERLNKLRNRLGVTGSTVTGGNTHVFLKHISRYRDLAEWMTKVRQIPDWFIEHVCKSAISYGLDKKLGEAASEFLIYRRDRLGAIVDSHRESFNIGDWPKQMQLLI